MLNMFPQPFFVKETQEQFVFGNKVYFIVDKSFQDEAFLKIVPELWNNFTAGKSFLEVVRKEGMSGRAIVSTNEFADVLLCFDTAYEYTLECRNEGIFFCFNGEKGLIHAFFTALQLVGAYRRKSQDFSACGVVIKDMPALEFRAMHICVFPETSLLFLKKTVRLLAFLKCTHIAIEFFGMLKPECFPFFGWEDAFTKEELASIIADGKAMGVEFIPMFNHFGHAGGSRFKAGKNVVLDQAPEYEEFFEQGGWTWNVQNPDVLELHEHLRKELCEIFGEGKFFHMGCDEVYACDPRRDPYDVCDNKAFMRFINQTADSICKLGRTPIMWGDMFLNEKDFPRPYCHNACNRIYNGRENLSQLENDVIVADWQYDIDQSYDGSVKFFLEQRDKELLVLSPWSDFGNISGRCHLAKKYGLFGVMGTTWNELQVEPKFMVYTACLMWENDERETSGDMWELLKVFAAQNIRKLVPSDGVYKNAGFVEHELLYKPL